jgi:hypothetical protein
VAWASAHLSALQNALVLLKHPQIEFLHDLDKAGVLAQSPAGIGAIRIVVM